MIYNVHSPISLVGDNWGAIAAYKGLSKVFNSINVYTSDANLRSMIKDDDHLQGDINEAANNVLIFSGYRSIVPDSILNNNCCINIHWSLLPKYRGLHSVVWAILNNETFLGLSIHLMTKYIDDGDIISQYRIENDGIRTSVEYIEQMNLFLEENLGYIIKNYLNGKIQLKENCKSLATWVGKRSIRDCQIDFNMSLEYLRNFFRALVYPYPLPYVVFNGRRMEVVKVGFHYQNVETHIGRILNIDDEGLWVKAKDGYLIIKELREANLKVDLYKSFRIGQEFDTKKL